MKTLSQCLQEYSLEVNRRVALWHYAQNTWCACYGQLVAPPVKSFRTLQNEETAI